MASQIGGIANMDNSMNDKYGVAINDGGGMAWMISCANSGVSTDIRPPVKWELSLYN